MFDVEVFVSNALCYLCREEIAENSKPVGEGFWAITVEDPDNPGAARAYPFHTDCARMHDSELFELMEQYRRGDS